MVRTTYGFGMTIAVEKNIQKMFLEEMEWILDTVLCMADIPYNGSDINIHTEAGMKAFGEELVRERFLPAWMSGEKAAETFRGLYTLMRSDKAWVPTLAMEYLLAKVIESGVENAESFSDKGDTDENPYYYPLDGEARNQVIKDIEDEYFEVVSELADEDTPLFGTDKKTFIRAKRNEIEDILYNYEHFSMEMLNFMYDDNDFTMLDKYSLDELRNSPLNSYFGILPKDQKYEEFTVSKDWLKADDFRFTYVEPAYCISTAPQ